MWQLILCKSSRSAMKSSLIYTPPAQIISFTLYVIFSWKIKNQFLAIILDGNHLKWARLVRKARPTHELRLPGSGHFFSRLIEEIFFALCFEGWVGLFCLFPQERGIFVGSRPCSSLQEQALGLLASDMPGNIKERYIFGAVSWYSPAYLFVIIWKKLLNWKEGQTIHRRTKPVRARSVQISMKHSCFNSYLNGLLSSWTTFLWPATADSFSQREIPCNLLRADERCVF